MNLLITPQQSKIDSRQNELKKIINNYQDKLNSIQEKGENLKKKMNIYYDCILSNIKIWKEDLDKINLQVNENSSSENLFQELWSKEKQFNETNRKYYRKMINNLKINDFREILKEFQDQLVKHLSKSKAPDSVNLQKIIDQAMVQDDCCLNIVFNQLDTYMISTKLHQILIWNFDNGIISLKQSLNVHTKWVNCLVYSKKIEAFISGSDDRTIRITQLLNGEWISSEPSEKHQMEIYCLLLNQKEDQLFSAGCDKSIIVWGVDLKKNKLTFLYQLNKHKASIFSLSLNQSEEILISCANEKDQIIVWEKEKDNQMKFKYIVKQQDSKNCFGKKILFLSSNIFIWVTATDGFDKIFVFEQRKGVFQENKENTIQLDENPETEDQFQFPIITNSQTQIIIIRHKRKIYFFKAQSNVQLKKIGQIDCLTKNTYGQLTNNGKFLVYWDNNELRYLKYEISYC